MAVTKTLKLRIQQTGATKAQKEMTKLGSSVQNTVKNFIGFAGAALSIGLVTRAIGDLVKRGAQIEGVEKAFNRLNISLEDLRKSTRGTVGEFELMQRAVMAQNLMGSVEGLGDLFKFATIRARELGVEADYLVESIVTGIGRKSVLILDNLGISAAKVQAEFKRTGDFAKAVGTIVREDLSNMDENIGSAADAIDRAKTLFGDWYDELAKGTSVVATAAGNSSWFADTIEYLTLVTKRHNEELERWFTNEKEISRESEAVARGTSMINNALARTSELVVRNRTINQAFYDEFKTQESQRRAEEKQKEEFQLRYNLSLIDQAKVQSELIVPATERQWIELKKLEEEYSSVKKVVADTSQITLEYAHVVQGVANQMSSAWSQALLNQWNEGQNFFDNMVRGFQQMIASMIAEMAAKAAIFGFLNIITGGAAGGLLGGFSSFMGFASGGGGASGGGASGGGSSGGDAAIENLLGSNSQSMSVNILLNRRHIQTAIVPILASTQRLGRHGNTG